MQWCVAAAVALSQYQVGAGRQEQSETPPEFGFTQSSAFSATSVIGNAVERWKI